MNQPQRPQPQRPQPQRSTQPVSREPDLDPTEILTMSTELVTARLSTAKSIAEGIFGEAVSEETVISVYDRLNDQIAEMLNGEEEPDEEQ